MTELQVIARHTMAVGNEAEVLNLLPAFMQAARDEPGNLGFDVYRNIEDPRSYVLLERYTCAAAFAEHRETAHFKNILLAQIVPLLVDRVIETYEPTALRITSPEQ